MTGFDHVETGLPATFSEIRRPIDFRRFAWNWERPALDALLARAPDVFVCAITSDTVELRHLFDRVFVLSLDRETLARRLRERAGAAFGKDPHEADGVLAHNAVIAGEWRRRGAVVIDATQPLTGVVDDIVERTR